MSIPYTAKQLLQYDYGDDIEEVSDEIVGTYRHGNVVEVVYQYGDKFFAISFRTIPNDGPDEDTLIGPYEVKRVVRTITAFEAVK